MCLGVFVFFYIVFFFFNSHVYGGYSSIFNLEEYFLLKKCWHVFIMLQLVGNITYDAFQWPNSFFSLYL
jgi:hypothetical protein